MTAPILIQLTPEEEAKLQQLLRNPHTHPKGRRRTLALRLSAQGWSAPASPSSSDATRYPPQGLQTMAETPLRGACGWQGPGCFLPSSPEVKAHLSTLLSQDRLWTASHLQEALAAQLGVPVHPSTLTRPLKRIRYVGSANLR